MASAVVASAAANGLPSLPQIGRAKDLFAERMSSDIDPRQLRRIYLQLALLFHPDKRPEEDRMLATQLFQAIAAVYEDMLKARDNDGASQPGARVKSPVAAAAELGDIEELKRMLHEQPDQANAADDLGVYPLMFAAAGGCIAAAEVLLDFGADLHALNPINWSVLLYAALGNHSPMVRFLVGRGAEVTSHELILAAYTGNPDSLEALLEFYKGSVSQLRTTESKKTLLHLACEGLCFLKHSAERHGRCVELILNCGVPIDAMDPQKQRTCLQDFVGDVRWRTRCFENSSTHMAVLEQLCIHGASVVVEDLDGNSAMSLATDNGLTRAREILFQYT